MTNHQNEERFTCSSIQNHDGSNPDKLLLIFILNYYLTLHITKKMIIINDCFHSTPYRHILSLLELQFVPETKH